MMKPTKFPDGSGERPMEAACIRALDAYMAVSAKAEELISDLDEMTMPGVPRIRLGTEDSLALAIADAHEIATTPAGDGGKKSKLGG